jgi:sulfur oxidation c-type cytochrome SoxX
MRIKIFNFKYLLLGLLLHSGLSHAQTNYSDRVGRGFEIIYNRNLGNCVTCHRIDKSVSNPVSSLEKQGNFGPDLSKVGSKYNQALLTQWVTDARKIRPQTFMPPYGSLEDITIPNQANTLLTHEQIALVVEALLTLK